MYDWQYDFKARCCICDTPISATNNYRWVPLMKKAIWKKPAWAHVMKKMSGAGAISLICGNCLEAREKSGLFGSFKYAVEYRDEQVIYHEVEQLKDLAVLPVFIRKGARVNYHSVIGEEVTIQDCTITHDPWPLGGPEGEMVVMLDKVRGCVSVRALSSCKEDD